MVNTCWPRALFALITSTLLGDRLDPPQVPLVVGSGIRRFFHPSSRPCAPSTIRSAYSQLHFTPSLQFNVWKMSRDTQSPLVRNGCQATNEAKFQIRSERAGASGRGRGS